MEYCGDPLSVSEKSRAILPSGDLTTSDWIAEMLRKSAAAEQRVFFMFDDRIRD